MGAALLAVGSVGFSAWVISGGTTEADPQSIGVSVAAVNDNRLSFSSAPAWSNTCTPTEGNNVSTKTLVSDGTAHIVFGPKSSDTSGKIQASGYGLDDLEHLFVEIEFTLQCTKWSNNFSKVSLDFSASGNTSTFTALHALETSGYILNPLIYNTSTKVGQAVDIMTDSNYSSAPVTSAQNSTYDAKIVTSLPSALAGSGTVESPHTQAFKVTLSWSWGSLFSYTTPGVTEGDDAAINTTVTNLKAFKTAFGNSAKSLSVKVVATSK